MNDPILLNVKSLIDAYPMKDDKTATFNVCYNLLKFCYEKDLLLKKPFNDKFELNPDVIIRKSDLTDKGQNVFWNLSQKWFAYTDRTNKIDNVEMLEKWLSKM